VLNMQAFDSSSRVSMLLVERQGTSPSMTPLTGVLRQV
jgi:hypothetical protein